MIKNNLAIFGGEKKIKESFKKFNFIGKEELDAVHDVIKTGVLSEFVGADVPEFYGGVKIKLFEDSIKEYFDVDHAIAINSWTSGIECGLKALKVGRGDEVIVPPWTMSATAFSIINVGAKPVFADIETDYFCIDPKDVERKITNKTKVILPVDIYGQSADINPLIELARKFDIKIFSDSAQSPGALYNGKKAGTIGDIGGFSFNYHKHIHCGEGGVIVTNDDELAERCRLLRNHGESKVDHHDKNIDISGHNFRMTEIEAAIAIEQMKKFPMILDLVQSQASKINKRLKGIEGIVPAIIRDNSTHAFYALPIKLVAGLDLKRHEIVQALRAEGVPVTEGYRNLHKLPYFSHFKKEKLNCPNAEYLNDVSLISIPMTAFIFNDQDINLICSAFEKVLSYFINN